MTAPNRTSIVKGAGHVKINTTQLYAKGDVEAKYNPEVFPITVAGYGTIDERLADSVGSISFTPSGRVTAGILSVLYPYLNPVMGADIFGATDTPTEVHSILGQKFVFHNTALRNMPSLKLSARETAFTGNVEIAFLPKNETARSAANSAFTGPTAAAFTPNIARADIVTVPYTAIWDPDGTPVEIWSKDGWQLDFTVNLEPLVLADHGTIGMHLTGVEIMAKCQPINISEGVLALMRTQGADAVIGGSVSESKGLRIYAAGGLDVNITDAVLLEGGVKWGDNVLRSDEIGFRANRPLAEGAPAAYATIAMYVAPEE